MGRPEVLFAAETVSNRGSQAQDVTGVELSVPDNIVIMRLRADEEMTPEVVAHAASGMQQEVVGADGDGTGSAAVAESVVENQSLHPKTSHEIGAGLRADARGEDAVDVGENGAVPLLAVVKPLLVAECRFCFKAEMVLENCLGADAGVGCALLGWRREGLGSADGSGSEQRAASGSDVNLLSTGETG